MGVERLETVEELLEREWTVDGIPLLSARVCLPKLKAPEMDRHLRRMDRYYRQFARSYLRYCGRFLFPQAQAEFRQAVPLCPTSPPPWTTVSPGMKAGCGACMLMPGSGADCR